MILAYHPPSNGERWAFADVMRFVGWTDLLLGVVGFGICLFVLGALRRAGGADE